MTNSETSIETAKPASTGERLRRPATARSLWIGDTRVSYVPDGAVQLPARRWLPGVPERIWTEHPEYLDDAGNLIAGIGGLLVERGDRALLIDAGFGPQSMPAEPGNAHGAIYGGALLDSLAALGRSPSQIEAVAFTHLHIDHLGWAWHPAPDSDKPAFTEAAYLLSHPEWSQRHRAEEQGTGREILEALSPRVRTVDDGEEIFPDVRVRFAPGHTAGHTTYVIGGDGQRLLAFGDALHSPIQVRFPDWSSAVEHDPDESAEQRRRLLSELAEPGTIGFGIHFADVVFGQVRMDGETAAWHALDL